MHVTRLLSNKIRNQVYLRCTVHGYFIQDEQIGLEHFLLSESWQTLKILPIFPKYLVHRKEDLKNNNKEKPWLVPSLHTLKQSES